MRVFPVRMPSGSRYWTVLDDGMEPVPVADRFLRELRFGRDRAESTTEAYAGAIALFLRWCQRTGRNWPTAAADLGLFITWLKFSPSGDGADQVVPGPGVKPVRGERRINRILVAVRGFVAFAVATDEAPGWVLAQVYELADSRDLPIEAQGEDSGLRYRLRARHRLHEPDTQVDRASDEESVALFAACRSARDRLIVLLLARAGLRRGAVAGLRRSDVHFAPDNGVLGCEIEGAHRRIQSLAPFRTVSARCLSRDSARPWVRAGYFDELPPRVADQGCTVAAFARCPVWPAATATLPRSPSG